MSRSLHAFCRDSLTLALFETGTARKPPNHSTWSGSGSSECATPVFLRLSTWKLGPAWATSFNPRQILATQAPSRLGIEAAGEICGGEPRELRHPLDAVRVRGSSPAEGLPPNVHSP
jgi:hypothetical protein